MNMNSLFALGYLCVLPLFANAMMGDIDPYRTREIGTLACNNKRGVEVGSVTISGSYHQFEDHSPRDRKVDEPPPRGGPESRRIVSKLMGAHFSYTFKTASTKREKASLKRITEALNKNQKHGLVLMNKKNVSVEDPAFEAEVSQYILNSLNSGLSCIGPSMRGEALNQTLTIVAMEVEYSNGSIGPHNKSKKWLAMPDEKFKALGAKVLLNSKVNNQVSLAEFFADRSKVKERKFEDIPSGGGYAYYTTIKFSNGQEIQINDYSPYTLSAPFDELFKYVISGPAMPSL